MVKIIKRQQGFTLIEILVVTSILAVLVALLVPVALNQLDKADITAAESDVNSIIKAIENFRADTKEYPTRNSGGTSGWVSVLYTGASWNPGGATFAGGVDYGTNQDRIWNHFIVNDSDRYPAWNSTTLIGWHGPYLDKDRLDPWGNMYVFATSAFNSPGGSFYAWVLSAGPNKEFETDDENTLEAQGDDLGKWLFH